MNFQLGKERTRHEFAGCTLSEVQKKEVKALIEKLGNALEILPNISKNQQIKDELVYILNRLMQWERNGKVMDYVSPGVCWYTEVDVLGFLTDMERAVVVLEKCVKK